MQADERLILHDCDRPVPQVQAVREAVGVRVLDQVWVARVERRQSYVVAAAQNDRTGRSEQVDAARGAVANDHAATHGHNDALDTGVNGEALFHRSHEDQRLAAFLHRGELERLQNVDVGVHAFVDVE